MKLFTILLIVMEALIAPPRCMAQPQTVQAADGLVNSIGVNTHFGYTGRPYYDRFDAVAAKLGELGVRHIRDGVDGRAVVASRIRSLHTQYGIGVVQIVGPRLASPQPWTGKLDPSKIHNILNTIKSLYGDANEAIEGPNEYDNTHHNADPKADDPDWPATLKSYTQALDEKVKSDPALKDRPVIGPSMAHAGNALKVPDLSAFITFGNMHPYPGGWNPSRQLDDYNLRDTRHMTGARPIWATETGYQNAMKKPPGGHNPCPEDVAGKYGPILVAEYFRRGIARAYFYELVDEGVDPANLEDNFGLLRNDLSEKPIFVALKSTIALLKDSGGAFKTGALDYALSPNTPELRQLLLQKRDGTFDLLLWRDTPCYDAVKRKPIVVQPKQIVLKFAGPVGKVATYFPSTLGTKPATKLDRPTRVTLALSDEMLIVQIVPAPAR